MLAHTAMLNTMDRLFYTHGAVGGIEVVSGEDKMNTFSLESLGTLRNTPAPSLVHGKERAQLP